MPSIASPTVLRSPRQQDHLDVGGVGRHEDGQGEEEDGAQDVHLNREKRGGKEKGTFKELVVRSKNLIILN